MSQVVEIYLHYNGTRFGYLHSLHEELHFLFKLIGSFHLGLQYETGEHLSNSSQCTQVKVTVNCAERKITITTTIMSSTIGKSLLKKYI